MSTEGLLLGARQLKYLARAYAVNIVCFLSALSLALTLAHRPNPNPSPSPSPSPNPLTLA